MSGVVVMTTKADDLGKVRLNLCKLPNGFYIIKVGEQELKLEVRH